MNENVSNKNSSSEKQLRVAVIGVGALGQHHARILSERNDIQLVAVADPRTQVVAEVAQKCGCAAVTDCNELIGSVDAVSVVVPTSAHLAVATQFLQNNIPVLVEKPLAMTAAEAKQLVETAHAHNTILQVGHIERFNAAMQVAKPLIREPKHIRTERLSPYAFRSMDIGAVLDLMIHDIDLVLSLVDSPVVQVDAFGLCLFGGNEDKANARLTFENGCIADLTANRLHPTPRRTMEVLSLDGNVSIDFHTREVTAYSMSDRLRFGPSPVELAARPEADLPELKADVFGSFLNVQQPTVPKTDALTAELDHFVDCVIDKKQPLVNGDVGLAAMEIAETILQRLAEHQWDGHAEGLIGPHLQTDTTRPALRIAG